MQENENAADDVRRDGGGCVPQRPENVEALQQRESKVRECCTGCDSHGRLVRLRGIRGDLDSSGESHH